jgi:hypothetical protein
MVGKRGKIKLVEERLDLLIFCSITPKIQNLPAGSYDVYINGGYTASRTVAGSLDVLEVEIRVSGLETDVIVLRACIS